MPSEAKRSASSRMPLSPDGKHHHDFIRELSPAEYDDLKVNRSSPYCTGGIRCRILSPRSPKNRGFKEITRSTAASCVTAEYGDKELAEGSLYARQACIHMEFTPDTVTIGKCKQWGAPSNKFENCQ